MDDERGGDDETGQSQAVADPLHHDAGGAEGRGGDVGTAKVVDDDADGDVGDGHDALADEERAGVVSGVTHLGDDGEEGGRAGEGEDQGRQRGRALGEGRVADERVVRDPDAARRGRSRAVLNSDGDGERQDCALVSLSFNGEGCFDAQGPVGILTGGENGDEADPGEPGDLPQRLDAAEAESGDGGHRDEDGSAGAVGRYGVESNGGAEHAGASDEDPVCHVADC